VSRERPSDRWHNARLLGSILLAVVQASGEVPQQEQVCTETLTAAALAAQVGTTESQIRVWASKLVAAGCLSEDRVSVFRQSCARRVHVYQLPPRAEQHGRGRRPRWNPVALVVDPICVAAEHTALQRATEGMLGVAVAARGDALRLLNHLAFELVAHVQPAPAADGDEAALDGLRAAAHSANCGPVLLLHAAEPSPRPALSPSMHPVWSTAVPAVASALPTHGGDRARRPLLSAAAD
jgi:hypothetical protein